MDGTFSDDQVHRWLQEIADEAYVSLHYDTPALGGVGLCEISGGGYVRPRVLFSSPSNRAIWSLDDVRWSGLKQNQLTHYGIWSRAVNGRLIAYGQLPEKTTIMDGWGYVIYQGELAVSLD